MRILVIEDEKKVAALVCEGLTAEGWTSEACHDGEEGLRLASQHPYDALVLDIMLPNRDGLSVLAALREAHNTVPVVLLTARGDVEERVNGLNLGADDYLAKPFSMTELAARLKAVWRRRSGEGIGLLSHADLTVNLLTHTVQRGAKKIELTGREFTLLEFMIRRVGRAVTRLELCEHVWGYNFDPGTNVVDVAVQRLRKKIDENYEVKLIQTVRGAGYMLKAAS
jgi:DNA-binding response OmpR family regulator